MHQVVVLTLTVRLEGSRRTLCCSAARRPFVYTPPSTAAADIFGAANFRYALAQLLLAPLLRTPGPVRFSWAFQTDETPINLWLLSWWLGQLRLLAAKAPNLTLDPPVEDAELETSTRHSSNASIDSLPDPHPPEGLQALLYYLPALDAWRVLPGQHPRRVPVVSDAALLAALAAHLAAEEESSLSAPPASLPPQEGKEKEFVPSSDLAPVHRERSTAALLLPYYFVQHSPSEICDFPPQLLPSLSADSDGFKPLGGHSRSWAYSPFCVGSKKLVKRCLTSEAVFYLALAALCRSGVCAQDVAAEMSPAMWYGQHSVEETRQWAQAFQSYTPEIAHVFFSEGTRESYVEMTNAAYQDPLRVGPAANFCEIDLKVGTQLYGMDADAAKRQRMILKAQSSTSGNTGLCIIAYRCQVNGISRCVTRPESRGIVSEPHMLQHLREFFALISTAALQSLTAAVSELIGFFGCQKLLHLNGSSLLISYTDGAAQIKIIDFPHASFYHSHIDISTLTGLRNLLVLLTSLDHVLSQA